MKCPICDSAKTGSWMMGHGEQPEGHEHNPNKWFCEDCRHQWFVNCPKCNWSHEQWEIHDRLKSVKIGFFRGFEWIHTDQGEPTES
jgi:hypothetical protein